jgi:glycosyltransferase involved in cell wall biosynthesis
VSAPRLLYLVADDWYFCSHRLPLAQAALAAGFEVGVITRVREQGERIRNAGVTVFPVELARGGKDALADLRALRAITSIYRGYQPDLVHHVAMKPVIYGSIAARRAGVPHVVNALAGLGWTFSSLDLGARLVRPFVLLAFRALLGRAGSRLIVQNPDDQRLIEAKIGVPRERIALIRGSGVDLEAFPAAAQPQGFPLVVLASRMLRDKGVEEFVAAARMLKGRARFALVGDTDAENPGAIPALALRAWAGEGIVEWRGFRTDVAAIFREAAIVCLPSWREGLPKVLIEAAATARAVVTCDVPGCREVVRQGDNGLLVPPRDPAALAEAIGRLLEDAALRARMGGRGRERAEKEFSVGSIAQQTLSLYRELLGSGPIEVPTGRPRPGDRPAPSDRR